MLANIGDFLFRYRNLLFPLCLPLAFLPGPRLFDEALVAAALGFAASAVGELVRASTIGLQYIVRGGRDRRVYANDLVTGGLYSHTRNPMYVGNMLILVGLTIASNSWACVAVAIPFYAFVCAAIVAAEERYLRGRFGADFDAYCRDVPGALERAADPLGDPLHQLLEHLRARGRDRDEHETTLTVTTINAVEHQQVKVHIEVERTAEALDQGHGPGHGARARQTRLADQVAGNRAVDDAEHLRDDFGSCRQQVAQCKRQRHHPLANGLLW